MSTKDYSNKQESMAADFLGWKIVAGSGAATCTAGDIISDAFLGECKTHETAGSKVVFRQDVWDKIRDESMVFGRRPVLISDDGTQNWRRTYCLTTVPSDMKVLPKDEFVVSSWSVKYKKQLNFDPDKIYAKFRKTDSLVCVVPWYCGDVLIMNLETFNKYQQYM